MSEVLISWFITRYLLRLLQFVIVQLLKHLLYDYLLYPSVRVHVLKKVIVIDLIDKNGIHLGVVSLYRYRLFTSHSTLANSINLFIVLISTYFTSLSLITKKVTCQ